MRIGTFDGMSCCICFRYVSVHLFVQLCICAPFSLAEHLLDARFLPVRCSLCSRPAVSGQKQNKLKVLLFQYKGKVLKVLLFQYKGKVKHCLNIFPLFYSCLVLYRVSEILLIRFVVPTISSQFNMLIIVACLNDCHTLCLFTLLSCFRV